jgi:hypothetical protein
MVKNAFSRGISFQEVFSADTVGTCRRTFDFRNLPWGMLNPPSIISRPFILVFVPLKRVCHSVCTFVSTFGKVDKAHRDLHKLVSIWLPCFHIDNDLASSLILLRQSLWFIHSHQQPGITEKYDNMSSYSVALISGNHCSIQPPRKVGVSLNQLLVS